MISVYLYLAFLAFKYQIEFFSAGQGVDVEIFFIESGDVSDPGIGSEAYEGGIGVIHGKISVFFL